MTKTQRAKMERFIARKNPLDQIVETSDTLHPAWIRFAVTPDKRLFIRSYDNPRYRTVEDLEGDAEFLEEWLEHAYSVGHTVRYYEEG